jgi:pantothenate synthetase
LIFASRQAGQERVFKATSKYGVEVEFITTENYLHSGHLFEEVLKDKDLSVIVVGSSHS